MKSLERDWVWRGLGALGLMALCGCEPLVNPEPGATGKTCGGLLGQGCERGTFCSYELTAQCGAADQTGTCEPIPQACDAVYAPVCGCDGKTYGNLCEANAKGVSAASDGACAPAAEDASAPPERDAGAADSCAPPPETDAGDPSARVCGGFAGLRCGAGEFCDYGAICSSIADGTGVCRTTPMACTREYLPVCGCDGKTYGNECTAHSSGVSVAHKGECKPSNQGRTCGGIAALACRRGEFCNYEPPTGQGCAGDVADAAGVCQPIPEACTLQYDPVCGCDGKTYGNACAAHAAGVSVAKDGEC